MAQPPGGWGVPLFYRVEAAVYGNPHVYPFAGHYKDGTLHPSDALQRLEGEARAPTADTPGPTTAKQALLELMTRDVPRLKTPEEMNAFYAQRAQAQNGATHG